jgi:hypothetical protein
MARIAGLNSITKARKSETTKKSASIFNHPAQEDPSEGLPVLSVLLMPRVLARCAEFSSLYAA